MGTMARMLVERQLFCNKRLKRLANVERDRDDREPSRGIADVHAYDTHYLLVLRLAGSVKTGHHTGACRK